MKNTTCALLLICISAFTIGCQEKEVWLTGFVKPAENPIMTADSTYLFHDPIQDTLVRWQMADVFNPAAVVRNDTVFVLFRAEDNPSAILGYRTSRVGLAYSKDGIHFTKFDQPVFYPDQDDFKKWDYPGGVEDPRVVETEDGTYVMLYTSWNRDLARLSAATSKDLKTWTKKGPVFEDAYNGKFLNLWSKSGSIVTRLENNRLIAAKINGKYWMYWGEDFVNVASSDNLVDWTPTLDADENLLKSMETRAYKFDSRLTEPGPPALLTDSGILLFYNGKNDEGELADPAIAKGAYCDGQALFDKNNPARLINRMDHYFIKPDLEHEVTGQYKAGTTFIEGLVYFQNKWFLYYGTADSMVGLAIKED